MRKKNTNINSASGEGLIFTNNLNFAVEEAYKLLRTNVVFSFSAEEDCHIVGITSSVPGEGKSTTSCNLAYALSVDGKKTLLLEGDLRLPTIANKLSLERAPGLSNILVSKTSHKSVIQHCESAPGLDIITAGECPPNPSELLGSKKMAELFELLSKEYEYIIIDLPPISDVSDALVISKFVHGIIVVVRNGVVDRKELADTIRQLELVGVRILGFAYKDASENKRHYGKYYKSYYKEEAQPGKGTVKKK